MREQDKKLAEELLFSEKRSPSFAKQLFFGKFDQKLVFPFPEEAHNDTFLDKVKAFVREEIDPDLIDREAEIPQSVIAGLAKLGVLGMTVPKEFGGLGMSQQEYCRVTETVARRCSSTALYINVHQSIGLKSLLLFGTKEQQDKWLPRLATGEITAAFSLTEPNAGSDANGIETRAVYDPKQKAYIINGQKQWTTSGAIAQVLTVMAKVDDKVTAFLVTPDMPGFRVKERALEKVGMRGTWTANLEFKDMVVPEENILGPLGKGLKVCLTVLDFGRVTFGSTCTGLAKELCERAIDHATHRYQFKQPLASFSLVKQKIAEMCAFTYAMDATTKMTAGFIDRDIEDFMLEAAILKVFTSDAAWKILYDTMQIYGGRSFFTDQPFERMMRDSRLNMIGEGSNEVLRAFIGVVGIRDVGVELKEMIDGWKISGVRSLLSRLKAPVVPLKSEHLQEEAKELSKLIKKFSWTVVKLLARYGEEIVDHQMQLDRLSSMAIVMYTTTAVLSKLETEHATGNDLEMGKLYCKIAFRMANRFNKGVDNNIDEEIETLSDHITGIH